MILFGDRTEQNKNGPAFLCFKQNHRCEISGHINLDCFLLEGKGIARFWGLGFWRSLWSSQQDSQVWNEPSQGFLQPYGQWPATCNMLWFLLRGMGLCCGQSSVRTLFSLLKSKHCAGLGGLCRLQRGCYHPLSHTAGQTRAWSVMGTGQNNREGFITSPQAGCEKSLYWFSPWSFPPFSFIPGCWQGTGSCRLSRQKEIFTFPVVLKRLSLSLAPFNFRAG